MEKPVYGKLLGALYFSEAPSVEKLRENGVKRGEKGKMINRGHVGEDGKCLPRAVRFPSPQLLRTLFPLPIPQPTGKTKDSSTE